MAEDAGSLIDASSEARRSGDHASALNLATRAEALARSADDRQALSAALAALGRLRRDEHQLQAALDLYEESATLARNTDDLHALAHGLRHIRDIAAEQGDLERAERCFAEAGELIEKNGATALEQANFLRSKAILREKQGERGHAARLWSNARALYDAGGIEAGVREADNRLATLLS